MDGCLSTCSSDHSTNPMFARAQSVQPRFLPRAAAIAVLLAGAMLGSGALKAQPVDPGDIAAGMRIFQRTAGCQLCHGWAGDGRKMDNQMPDGADLRESTLDRQNMIMTIKCGRPGRSMPAFDKFAYSDGRCNGLKQADLKTRNLQLTDPPATLAPNEVELLADFLFAKIVGKGPMDHAKCIEYWGSEVEACSEYPR